LLPPGESFELLGDYQGVQRDRFVELGVAADVHGRFPVVRDEELQATLREQPEWVVARSLVEDPRMNLLHVMATRQQLREIALTSETICPEHTVAEEVLPGLRLLGFDDAIATVDGVRQVAVTLYWTMADAAQPVTLSMIAAPASTLREVREIGHCRGTLPLAQWSAFDVVTETVVLPVADGDTCELLITGEDVEQPLLRLPLKSLSGH